MTDGESDRSPDDDHDRGRNISRRQVLAGGLLFVGGSSQLPRSTAGRFSDAESTSGTIRVESDPTLNYSIIDQTGSSGAAYEIAYQVERVANFDRIEIRVENRDKAYLDVETFTKSTREGTVSYPGNGGSDGGAEETDTYEFTFNVYKTGATAPVVQKIATDNPGGEGTGEGEFGDANSSELDWVLIEDNMNNSGGRFNVYYEVLAREHFSEVRVQFTDETNSYGNRTMTSTDSPNGEVNYSVDGTDGHTFTILVEVVSQSGLVVDDYEFEGVVSNGTNPSTYGDPIRPDSPQLDSFTLSDDSTDGEAVYALDYAVTSTNRLDSIRATFRNTDQSYATKTFSDNGGDSTTGSFEYSSWTNGDFFEITVEVFEARNGITFPVDSGTLEDIADGGEPKTWPGDTN